MVVFYILSTPFQLTGGGVIKEVFSKVSAIPTSLTWTLKETLLVNVDGKWGIGNNGLNPWIGYAAHPSSWDSAYMSLTSNTFTVKNDCKVILTCNTSSSQNASDAYYNGSGSSTRHLYLVGNGTSDGIKINNSYSTGYNPSNISINTKTLNLISGIEYHFYLYSYFYNTNQTGSLSYYTNIQFSS